ncbi:hypothetical protein N0U25_22680 [Pseudomonas sivasensis]|uniref:hypothetical protein n=1 Tax=Pseudomonas sivasensis TaxID=1880678 RepID=UPI0021AAA913|nr:hypothetical protein [Pseudomonas sivasensis]MCT4500607.1 hypothetical protein [Pseudomonas sivasensis]
MPTTVIEVIDTSIKIGLGGLIGFAGTYVVTKLNHGHDAKKDVIKRRYDALEQVAAHIEEFSHVALKYWALVVECVRVENGNKEWPKERAEQLELVKAEYFSEAKNITIAESKLLLLGLEPASAQLRKYTNFLKNASAYILCWEAWLNRRGNGQRTRRASTIEARVFLRAFTSLQKRLVILT